MFESVTIENFRGIEKLEVPLSPLTVLVGPNGVGKSSILDALLVNDENFGRAVTDLALTRRQGLADPFTWLVRFAQSEASIVTRHGGVDVSVKLGVRGRQLDATRMGAGSWPAVISVTFGPNQASFPQTGPTGHLPVVLVDSAKPFNSKEMAVRFGEIKRSDLRPTLEAALRAVEPRIRGIDLDAALDGDAHAAVDIEGIGTRPLALSGDGVRFLAQLIVGLMQARGGTALLEEPETHLHPSGIRALADAVVSRVAAGDQIVLSTHSLELVERLRGRLGAGGPPVDVMSVVRLYREGSALKTRVIDGDRIAFVLDEMGEDLR